MRSEWLTGGGELHCFDREAALWTYNLRNGFDGLTRSLPNLPFHSNGISRTHENISCLGFLLVTNIVTKRSDNVMGVKIIGRGGVLWDFYPVWTLGRFD